MYPPQRQILWLECEMAHTGRNLKHVFIICVCIRTFAYTCEVRKQLAGVGSLLSLSGFQVLNSGCCVWWQVALPAEPSHWAQEGYLFIYLPLLEIELNPQMFQVSPLSLSDTLSPTGKFLRNQITCLRHLNKSTLSRRPAGNS